MVDIEKLKALANEAIADECWEPLLGLTGSETEFAKAASPAAVLELIAENERFKAERDQLRAEVEALRKDAERYRWLRDGASEQSEQSDPWDSVGHIQPPLVCLKPGLQVAQTGHDLDSAIDAAMAAKEGE